MRLINHVVFVLSAVIFSNIVYAWKPIVGPRVHRPIIVDDSAINAASSSKSTITFAGQTISTSIGDIDVNDASGPLITVDPPDLTSDLNGESRYLTNYDGGKVLTGLFTSSATAVSFLFFFSFSASN